MLVIRILAHSRFYPKKWRELLDPGFELVTTIWLTAMLIMHDENRCGWGANVGSSSAQHDEWHADHAWWKQVQMRSQRWLLIRTCFQWEMISMMNDMLIMHDENRCGWGANVGSSSAPVFNEKWSSWWLPWWSCLSLKRNAVTRSEVSEIDINDVWR